MAVEITICAVTPEHLCVLYVGIYNVCVCVYMYVYIYLQGGKTATFRGTTFMNKWENSASRMCRYPFQFRSCVLFS